MANIVKIILYSGLIGFLGYLFIGLFLSRAAGQTMSNNNYIIKTENLDAVSNVNSAQGNETESSTQKTSQKISEGVNFRVQTGFENSKIILPFSVSLSSDILDFGSLTPTNPIIRTVALNVDNIPPYGYSVLAFENNPLQTASQAGRIFIPDATCDFGACSTENAAQWSNALTYGFGYRCDNLTGVDCDISFASSNFYKHFPDIASHDNPVSIMAGIGSNNKAVRISYKVNISGNQAQGTYSNVITYIAVPNF